MTKPTKTTTTKAIGYVRVSTDEQASEGVSLDAQRERIAAYCTMRGLDLVEVVVDAGVSGGTPLHERTGGVIVENAIKREHVRHVVALKLDRLFRDVEDCMHETKAWDRASVALHLVDLGGQALDTSSPMGRMFLTMLAGMAEWERGVIAERTRAALVHKKTRGERTGSVPYGWALADDGVHLVEVECEQHAIAIARRAREAGLSLRETARALSEAGFVSRAGREFAPQQIKAMVDFKRPGG